MGHYCGFCGTEHSSASCYHPANPGSVKIVSAQEDYVSGIKSELTTLRAELDQCKRESESEHDLLKKRIVRQGYALKKATGELDQCKQERDEAREQARLGNGDNLANYNRAEAAESDLAAANAKIAELEKENQNFRHPPSVGGKFTERTLASLAHAAQIQIGFEQEKPNCDTALIAILCDTVRLTLEAVPVVGELARAESLTVENGELRKVVERVGKLERWTGREVSVDVECGLDEDCMYIEASDLDSALAPDLDTGKDGEG